MPALTQSGVTLNYQLIGPDIRPDVPPVSLIHGLGANIAFWYLGAMRHLGRDHTFLLHDLRGHGASSMPDRGYGLRQMADDFLALLDHLGVDKTHVVGHSHGARVALLFAMLYPERVASLTVADTQLRALQPPMRLGDWPHWPQWKADLMARGVTSFPPEDAIIDFKLLAELGPRSAGGRGGRSMTDGPVGGGGPLAEAMGERALMRRRLQAEGPGAEIRANAMGPGILAKRAAGAGRRIDLQSRQMGDRGAKKWERLMNATHAPEEMHDESPIDPSRLRDIDMPALLMFGEMSHCVPTSDKLLEVMPNARRILVPNAGHFFPIVKPQTFARALNFFLRRVNAGEAVPMATVGQGAAASAGTAAMPRLERVWRAVPQLKAPQGRLARRTR
jgi:pimeloyl-ACP methyl ester carboxylesterase